MRTRKSRFNYYKRIIILLFCLLIGYNTVQAKIVDRTALYILLDNPSYITEEFAVLPQPLRKEMICLALTLYHEAKNQKIKGLIAVGQVAIRRTKVHYRNAKTICETVWLWKQFSWTHDGKSDMPSKYPKLWTKSQTISLDLYRGRYKNITEDFLHYVRCDLIDKVEWTKKRKKMKAIGDHCFMNIEE